MLDRAEQLELLHHGYDPDDAVLEFMVRDVASDLVNTREVFDHTMTIPWAKMRPLRTFDDPDGKCEYIIVDVSLAPELRSYPESAKLILEKKIREQLEAA